MLPTSYETPGRSSPPDYPPFTPEHHDRKPDGSRWEADDILNHGGSCIIGPLGTFLAEPVWDKEEIIYAELRLSDLQEAKVSARRDRPPKLFDSTVADGSFFFLFSLLA